MIPVSNETLLEAVLRILRGHALCDQCLGRQFAWLGTDTSNVERGRALKLILTMQADQEIRTGQIEKGKQTLILLAERGMFRPAQLLAKKNAIETGLPQECYLCSIDHKSVFDRIPVIAQETINKLQNIQFSSFQVGSVPVPLLAEREDEIRAVYGLIHGETLKSDFNRQLGKYLAPHLGTRTEFERPEVVVIYDMACDTIRLQIGPLFVYGRYRKLKRGIPQSRWDCTNCRGRGCDECGGAGRRYPDSIAEYIGIPIMEAAKGTDFKFHAAGREDIDVLMLGEGRPFVVEISRPQIRELDLETVMREINKSAENKVEVTELEITDRERAKILKHDSSENIKEYIALIKTVGVSENELRSVERGLTDCVIEQRTPIRVAHRRPDLVRRKRVYRVELRAKDEDLVEGVFVVQGGTYVKELISGDNGRTRPSVAEILGREAQCIQLDVIAIHASSTGDTEHIDIHSIR